ncbi:PRC-barrel domain-containing protein [Micromonospora sp. NPDC048909]|uniref:PRC-barrel domain-containing protein n=1 Tax=Micromonospora sp. NPDC048909 TaxID=3155643 RepID=UPI0033CE58DC
MEDLGVKVSYLALAVGTRVYDVDSAPVGVVEHVIADEQADILHGVIVAPPKPYGSHRFAHREQIADLYERGVVLSVPGAEMHEPGEDAPAREAEGAGDDPVQVGLRRAWEWLSRPR